MANTAGIVHYMTIHYTNSTVLYRSFGSTLSLASISVADCGAGAFSRRTSSSGLLSLMTSSSV